VDLARQIIKKKKFKTKTICSVLKVARSNQYKNKSPRPKRYVRGEDPLVLAASLEVLKDKNRSNYGYKRITPTVNRNRRKQALLPWNKKRILRVLQMNNLTLKIRKKKAQRKHEGKHDFKCKVLQ